jgi:hypothetical protein
MYSWRTQFSSLPSLETLKQIRSFKELPDGWHYGRGVAPSQLTALAAQMIVFRGAQWGLEDSDAMPGAGGEIQVTIYSCDSSIEFTVAPNLRIDYRREEGNVQTAAQNQISYEDALTILRDFASDAWLIFGSSTVSTTPREKAALATLPSETTTAFPSLTSTVRLGRAVQFAYT